MMSFRASAAALRSLPRPVTPILSAESQPLRLSFLSRLQIASLASVAWVTTKPEPKEPICYRFWYSSKKRIARHDLARLSFNFIKDNELVDVAYTFDVLGGKRLDGDTYQVFENCQDVFNYQVFFTFRGKL
jgi:hypothetical protein